MLGLSSSSNEHIDCLTAYSPSAPWPKNTAPLLRLIMECRPINKYATRWRIRYATGLEICLMLTLCALIWVRDLSNAYHLVRLGGAGGRRVGWCDGSLIAGLDTSLPPLFGPAADQEIASVSAISPCSACAQTVRSGASRFDYSGTQYQTVLCSSSQTRFAHTVRGSTAWMRSSSSTT